MEDYNSVLQREIESVAISLPNILPEIAQMNGKTIMITGATGLIGTQLVKTILCYNRLFDKHIHVVAVGRNIEKLHNIYAQLADRPELHMLKADVCFPFSATRPIQYVIHGASITDSKKFVTEPVETIHTLLNGTMNLLELSKNNPVESFVYLSSLEVYGVSDSYRIRENDYGYIDFLNARSSYSEGKRMGECISAAYWSEYRVPVKIARLTQTMGCGISYNDNRVFAQFARSVVEGNDIVLNTTGQTVRSYCDICDAVRALLIILLRGTNGEAYNVANEETAISIADMAQTVCDMYPDSQIKVVFNTPDNIQTMGYNPEMKISLNTEKLKGLGWQPVFNLKMIFEKLIEGLREK